MEYKYGKAEPPMKSFSELLWDYVQQHNVEGLINRANELLDIQLPEDGAEEEHIKNVLKETFADIQVMIFDRLLAMLMSREVRVSNSAGSDKLILAYFDRNRRNAKRQLAMFSGTSLLAMEEIKAWDAIDFDCEMESPVPFARYSEKKLDALLKVADKIPKPVSLKKGMMDEVLDAICYPQDYAVVEEVFSVLVAVEEFGYSLEMLPIWGGGTKKQKRAVLETAYSIYTSLKFLRDILKRGD